MTSANLPIIPSQALAAALTLPSGSLLPAMTRPAAGAHHGRR